MVVVYFSVIKPSDFHVVLSHYATNHFALVQNFKYILWANKSNLEISRIYS